MSDVLTEADCEMDVRGLDFPLPILKTKKALSGLNRGETLTVIATDPGSVKDMTAFCSQTGHSLIESAEEQGDYTFVIQKS